MNSFPAKTNAAKASPFQLETNSGIDRPSSDSVVPLPCNLAATSQPEGRSVKRCPEQLRLHPELQELGWLGLIDELNDAARAKDPSVLETVLITTNGTILAGFGSWQLALLEGRREIHCIEYPLSETESLPFILTHHQPRRGWNAFVRIRLALTRTPYFQQRALDNMRAGGRYKGSANLPEAQHIDVRQQIAGIAGVGARSVSNVKLILDRAHPRLKDALRDGRLTINRAIQFCKLTQAEQLEQFTRYAEERETSKLVRRSLVRTKEIEPGLEVVAVLDALQQKEAQQPGSVVVRVGRLQGTVVLVGRDLLTTTHSQKDLKLT
jgi:hypothetical protein